ncbi:MAG TPA: hypothetical protein VGA70_05505 [Longimicrobiales bacterium]|jgi:pimeloyl-ACP methyl ester carboxylesterase
MERDGSTVPATLVLPPGFRAGVSPVWILLHGITRPGRAHPTLQRFSRALAASGAAVLIPEVPEWTRLRLAPEATAPTVESAVARLRSLGVLSSGARVGLMGFSFGAPQAVIASSLAGEDDGIAAAVGFGGYCDLERTLRFQFTGFHEWEGVRHHLAPDPYGRWIVGANHLTAVPGHEGDTRVAEALHAIAADAGDRRVDAWDPTLDALKEELAAGLDAAEREVFRLFAPPAGREPAPEAVEDLVRGLATAARTVSPLTEPAPFLGSVTRPTQLLHGRGDRLIPFSETLRLARHLGPEVARHATVTGLFSHSRGDAFQSRWEGLREGLILAGALRKVLMRV